MAGYDADFDGWLWAVDTETLNADFQNVFIALSGANAYNATNGTEGNWCPNGMLGTETYGVNADKYLGMYVKVDKTATFGLKAMNNALKTTEIIESEQVAQGGVWTWIEFNLSKVPEEYRYTSCIISSMSGVVQVDGLTLFNR